MVANIMLERARIPLCKLRVCLCRVRLAHCADLGFKGGFPVQHGVQRCKDLYVKKNASVDVQV